MGAVVLGGCSDESAAGGGAGHGAGGPGGPGGGKQPVPRVEVMPVELAQPKWDQTYPARVEGLRRVEVRPRVGGIIVRRAYQEGAVVKEGDELFQLDPQPFEVKVRQQKAQVARAEAEFRSAEREWNRVRKLFETGAVSERQRDTAQSSYELAQAALAVEEAELESAELDLAYSTVRAPIGGATSTRALAEGSLVTSQDRLTTITQLDPVYVEFALPEGDPAFEQVYASSSQSEATVQIYTRGGQEIEQRGKLDFTDSVLDPRTGTVGVRAVVPNPDRTLLPGQFARVAFDNLQLPPSAVIPEGAVLSTPRGSIVYVVGEGNTVEPRPVTLGPLTAEGQIVTGGLKDGDRVIMTALIRLQPGMPVEPVTRAGQGAAGQTANGAQNAAGAGQAQAQNAPVGE